MQCVIHTDRLVLRPANVGDARRIAQIMEYDISKWLVLVPHPYRLTDAEEWLSTLHFRENDCVWAIILDGEVIGIIGITPQLGYWVAKEHWGQGYASEAVQAVISEYSRLPYPDPLLSSYFVGNKRSERILSRLGFLPVDATVPTYSVARKCKMPLQYVFLPTMAPDIFY